MAKNGSRVITIPSLENKARRRSGLRVIISKFEIRNWNFEI